MPRPSRPPCPMCGGSLRREHRRFEDRLAPLPDGMRRYRCRSLICGWTGLIDRTPLATARRGAPRSTRALVLGLGLAGTVVALAWWLPRTEPSHQQQVAALPPGEHDDGVPLPTSHPWRQPAPQARPTPASTSLPAEPLTLRQHCAWGKPGRNPYRGTVEQALQSARLPAEVVQQVAAKVRAHQTVDRLTIANDGIVAQRTGERFSPRNVAMTYGQTLCLGTRVNFPAGHQEQADLYEASDGQGRRYAVMVPDVCGNVSVLSSSGEAPDMPGQVLTAEGIHVDGTTPDLQYAVQRSDRHDVPEPGTLACVGAALGVLAWLRRRR